MFDEETGLFSNYFRDYDPQTGRYVQVDPIGLEGGSLNLYLYAANWPTRFVDPDGLQVFTLNAFTRGEHRIPSEDAGRISDFSSAVAVTGVSVAAVGPYAVAGAIESWALVCRALPAAKTIKEACKNPLMAAALGASICASTSETEGMPPGSARQYSTDRTRLQEIKDASERARQGSQAGSRALP